MRAKVEPFESRAHFKALGFGFKTCLPFEIQNDFARISHSEIADDFVLCDEFELAFIACKADEVLLTCRCRLEFRH